MSTSEAGPGVRKPGFPILKIPDVAWMLPTLSIQTLRWIAKQHQEAQQSIL